MTVGSLLRRAWRQSVARLLLILCGAAALGLLLGAFWPLLALATALWFRAKQLGLPPFGRLVTVTAAWQRRPSVAGWPGRVSQNRRSP